MAPITLVAIFTNCADSCKTFYTCTLHFSNGKFYFSTDDSVYRTNKPKKNHKNNAWGWNWAHTKFIHWVNIFACPTAVVVLIVDPTNRLWVAWSGAGVFDIAIYLIKPTWLNCLKRILCYGSVKLLFDDLTKILKSYHVHISRSQALWMN